MKKRPTTFSKLLIADFVGLAGVSYGQVKIGDNPTSINQGSILELESTDNGK